MKLCIAEKPSVAREIARIVGANQKKDGYYEGNGYQISWTFGHFCTLKEPHEYNPQWKGWSLHSLPILPPEYEIKLIKNDGARRQFSIIASLVKNASLIINCGDAGQEGELIQRWVLEMANNTLPVKRLWISSLTDEAIREGFESLYDADKFDLLYEAGRSRAICDWMLGFNATRLYTLKYGNGKQVLSIGRVQTPTLALIVNRDLEILNFKPKTYWELKTTYRDTAFSALEGKFDDKEKALLFLEAIKEHPLLISSVEIKKAKEQPPHLFDLTSLQVECNNKFGYSAEETLQLIQNLYEKKYCSYPRVDTRFLPDDLYPKIPGILKQLTPYATFTTPLLGKKIRKSTKVFNNKKVTDHHAIIPTGIVPSGINDREKRVYDTITRRFISVFYADCIVSNTTILADINEKDFKTTGKQILEEGWRVLYKGQKNSDKEAPILPLFKKGESGPHSPELQEKQSSAPKSYTEASLLRAMESAGKNIKDEDIRDLMKANGIGRPSTRANIIETLFKRKYLKRDKKKIKATDTGIQLIGMIKNDMLKSAKLTGDWELKLREIESGEHAAHQFIKEMEGMVSRIVSEVKRSNASVVKERARMSKLPRCPKCEKAPIIKGKTAFGCSRWKDGCNFTLPFQFENKILSENQCFTLIQKGKLSISGLLVNGKKTKANLIFDTHYKLQIEAEEVSKPECPKCKNGHIIKGKTAYGCSNWKQCGFRIPDTFMGKAITENLMLQLVGKGKTGNSKSWESNGEKLEGALLLQDNFELQFLPKTSEAMPCPKCKKGTLLKGKQAYGCSEWKSGCKLILPFSYAEKKLTETQIRQLVANGRTRPIKGFVIDGQKTNGCLLFDKDFVFQFEKV